MGTRSVRLFWLLGIALLLGTAVGAGMVLNQPASGTTPPPAAGEPGTIGVVSSGFVDVDGGITFLNPLQLGSVTAVLVSEGDHVKEGDLLLTLDNRLQKMKLREAEADFAAAQKKLADAERQLLKSHQHDIEIQKRTIKKSQLELEAGRKDLEAKRKLLKEGQYNPTLLEMEEQKFKAGEEGVKIQEEVLAKLKDIDPQGQIDQLRENVKAKQAQFDQARLAYLECDFYAPVDGEILRLFVNPGQVLTGHAQQPAITFCPNAPRILRAEILQEFAHKVQKGQIAEIEDDSRRATKWKGKVERVSDWFTQRRHPLMEPFQFNDVRTLECIVSFDAGSAPVKIGQRMRVTIK